MNNMINQTSTKSRIATSFLSDSKIDELIYTNSARTTVGPIPRMLSLEAAAANRKAFDLKDGGSYIVKGYNNSRNTYSEVFMFVKSFDGEYLVGNIYIPNRKWYNICRNAVISWAYAKDLTFIETDMTPARWYNGFKEKFYCKYKSRLDVKDLEVNDKIFFKNVPKNKGEAVMVVYQINHHESFAVLKTMASTLIYNNKMPISLKFSLKTLKKMEKDKKIRCYSSSCSFNNIILNTIKKR